MRHWRWIVVALAVIAMAALVYPLVQTQKRLRLVQSELGKANEQVVQAKAGAAELERVIANQKTELDAANRERTQLQDSLREANSGVEQLREQFGAAQSQLSAKQSERVELAAELEKARQEVNQTQAEVSKSDTKLEAMAAELAKAKEGTEHLRMEIQFRIRQRMSQELVGNERLVKVLRLVRPMVAWQARSSGPM